MLKVKERLRQDFGEVVLVRFKLFGSLKELRRHDVLFFLFLLLFAPELKLAGAGIAKQLFVLAKPTLIALPLVRRMTVLVDKR